MCVLHREQRSQLAVEPVKLYEAFLDMMLGRRDEARNIIFELDYPALSTRQRYALVEDLAYWLTLNGYSDISLDQATDRIARMLPRLSNADAVTATSVLAYFLERTGLFRQSVPGRVEFSHRVLQEYLSARAALAQGDIGVLLQHATDDSWREIIIMAAGLGQPKQVENVLIGLIERGNASPRHKHQLHLLALACLETASVLSPDIRDRVLQEAKSVFPPSSDEEARLIAAVGDAAVALLGARVGLSEAHAIASVNALSLIGSTLAMNALAGYATDDRVGVARALGEAWDAFDKVEFARRVFNQTKTLHLRQLVSWEGFEHLSHITELTVDDSSQLEELLPLARLVNLTTLQLNRLRAAALDPLSALTKLTVLRLRGANMRSIQPLARLYNLISLDISQTAVYDLSPLVHLTRLIDLDISYTEVDDVRPLMHLAELRNLNIKHTRVRDLSLLNGNQHLKIDSDQNDEAFSRATTAVKQIRDIMRRSNVAGAMQYVPELTWILFLRVVDARENRQAEEAEARGVAYRPSLVAPYRWQDWAAPRGAKRVELEQRGLGAFFAFVNGELLPYLKGLKDHPSASPRQKVISEIVSGVERVRIDTELNFFEVLNRVHSLSLDNIDATRASVLASVFEGLLLQMGEKGNDGGQFFTPREVIRLMVRVIKPQVGETVYDPACGTGGFLVQSHEYHREQLGLAVTADQVDTFKDGTFFGREKENLIYPIALANLVLHGIDQPNVWHGNTLTGHEVYGGLFEGAPEQFDVILTNPPFGGKEGKEAQRNFDYKTGATQVLFVQHVINSLRIGGRCGIVLDEGVLFRTNETAFVQTKRKLLDECDLWCIVSLPGGVFTAAGSGVKTNLLFFTKGKPTERVWYYDLSDLKVGRKTPLTQDKFADFLRLLPQRAASERSWTVTREEIEAKKYDLGAVNPNALTNTRSGSEPRRDVAETSLNSTPAVSGITLSQSNVVLSHEGDSRTSQTVVTGDDQGESSVEVEAPNTDEGQIFISYPYEETAFAQDVAVRLKQQGLRVWIYEKNRIPGVDPRSEVDSAILNARLTTVQKI